MVEVLGTLWHGWVVSVDSDLRMIPWICRINVTRVVTNICCERL